MNNFRNRPKGNFMFEADWQNLFLLTEQWKKDLLFYQDDSKFLHHLIDKYFIHIPKREDIDELEEIEEGIMKIDTACIDLLKRTNKHLTHLGDLIDDPFKYDSHQFRTEHELLEDDIAKFITDYREHRKNTFKVTEKVIKEDKTLQKVQ